MPLIEPISQRLFGPRLCRLLVALACVLSAGWALPTASAQGQNNVTLAWDPISDPATAGYRLYDGVASGVYTNVLDMGNATEATVSNMLGGLTYFFAVRAYDTNGLESAFSNEITCTIPLPVASLPPRLGITLAAGDPTGTVPLPPSVVLSVVGLAGQTVNVLCSQDLRTWRVIGAVILDDTGSGQFIDSGGAGAPASLYRVQVQ